MNDGVISIFYRACVVRGVKIIHLIIFVLMKRTILLTYFICLLAAPYVTAQAYVGSSVLREGRWIRIAVTETGIHRLDYAQIRNMGFSDPSAVAIYGNNTGQLSFYNDGSAPDDLRKIAFRAEKGSDGVFNEGDYILFYAESTNRWIYDSDTRAYRFLRHHYSDTAWYFVTAKTGSAVPVASDPPPSLPVNMTSSGTDLLWRHEIESVNLIKSGREWYQQVISGSDNTVRPDLPGLMMSERIRYRIRVLGRSDSESSFTLRQGTSVLKYLAVAPVNMTDQNGIFANISTAEDSCMPASANPSFSITYNNSGNLNASGYIDFIDFIARGRLSYSDRQLFISDSRTVKPGGITKFTVAGSSPLNIWDVTDPFNPKIINGIFSADNTSFIVATDSLRKFVVFTTSNARYPVIKKDPVPNQDLHSLSPADMVIVTHPLFSGYAERIARMHSKDDGMTSIIVTPGQIYNEFSGGIPDAVAIRNFLKMIYDRGTANGHSLKYLLLLGDGSYENKTPPPGNPAFIPTWQSENSHVGVLSFTSDDFYGLLGDGEGEATGFLDIGIGRLPVADTLSAGIMVRKIEKYLSSSSMGSWRNIVCMVADDEDSNLHMNDAEGLSEAIGTAAPSASIQKIYLDAFRQMTTVTGSSYPDAVKAVNDRIAAGCLIFNYVGHGNETGLAHERVVRTDNINSWKNAGMLPLFITATCEFSRFDDAEISPATRTISARTSAGEMVLLNPDGGGIALMSTTRVVYSAPNYTLNRYIYDYAFDKAPDGRSMRLGDIIRLAKVSSGTGMNKRNFLLLGDPALRLAWPAGGKVVTDSINSVSVEFATDTVKALSLITVSGHLEDSNGNLMTDFNGVVEPVICDKPALITTLANDGGTPMTFPVTGNIIFRGSTEVRGGNFRFSFIVPLDINYSYGKGMITYYAHNDSTDLNGSYGEVIVGGFSDVDFNDTDGPVIRLFMNDTLFRDGGTTDMSPSLLALLSDKSGVNATGTGIGHDIIAWIDDDMAEAVVLNDLYKADIGVHYSGSLKYKMLLTEKGEHTVSLRAWDNLNNPSVATLRFVVETGSRFRLTDLLSFPNPATESTRFTAGHNRPDTGMDITITIFSTSGSAQRIIKEHVSTSGYALPDIPWDGCNSNGSRLSRGIYFWRIEAVTDGGEKASSTGRIIIL